MTESVLWPNRERRKLSVLLVINYDKSSQTLWIGQQRPPAHPFYCQEPGANHQLALIKRNSKNVQVGTLTYYPERLHGVNTLYN